MRRIVTSSECDSFDEVQKLLQELFDGQEQMDTKICQLANQKVPKKKKTKKGSVLMKTLVGLVVLTILIFSGVCHGGYVATDITSWICANPDILEIYLRDTVGAGTYVFTPIAAPAGNDIIEGKMYYDSSANTFYGSKNGTTWTEFATGGATSLDAAYNVGHAIDVDGTGVTLDNDVGDGTILLILTQDDTTNDPDAISIANASDAATAVSIDIDGTAGFDIQGTSDSWSVSIAGIFDGEGLTAVTNSQAILFDTNNEIEFGDNSEDVSMVFTNNTVTWATDSLVDQMAFGVVDNLTGIGAIAFDDAASTITLTSTGATDLTISQATADQDASLILQSSGTGTDALALISSVADIDIDSADNITIDAADDLTITTAGGVFTTSVTGGDYSVDATDASLNLDAGEAAANAIVIDASNAAGGIDMDCGTAGFNLTATGGDIKFENTSTKDIILDATAGRVLITGTESAADAIALVADGANGEISLAAAVGGVDVDATAGPVAIDNDGAGIDITVTSDGGSIYLQADQASVTDALKLTATAGGITMTSTAEASVWTHTATGAADDLTISVAGAQNSSLILSSAGTGEDALSLLATGTSASAVSILIDTADGGIVLTADGASKGDITIDAADDVTITAVGKTVITLGAEASTWQGNLLPATIVKQTVTTGALTSADCGYVNQVAVDAQTITLPATVAGLTYTIMCTAADGGAIVTVELDNADKFIGSGFTPADGEAMTIPKATQNYGDYFIVTAHTDGWIITEMVGTWAEATP